MGKKLAVWRRSANMLVIHFGKITRNENESLGEFALHVQCPWRFLRGSDVITGRSDTYTPRTVSENFDWSKWYDEGSWTDNLQEHLMAAVLKGYDSKTQSLENHTDTLYVETVMLDERGDVCIGLSGEFSLELFTDGVSEEHWRLLDFSNERHYVIGGDYSEKTAAIS